MWKQFIIQVCQLCLVDRTNHNIDQWPKTVCFHHHDNKSHSSMWLYYQWVWHNEPKWKGRTLWGASLARWGQCDHSTQTPGAVFSFCETPPISWPGCHDAVAVSGATQEAMLAQATQHKAMCGLNVGSHDNLTFPLIDERIQNVFAKTKILYSCNTVCGGWSGMWMQHREMTEMTEVCKIQSLHQQVTWHLLNCNLSIFIYCSG